MISAERPENELLICVARPAREIAQRERVRLLLRSDLDWDYLTAMAYRHSVIPLLYYHINSVSPEAVPPQVLSRLRRRSDENTRQSLFLTGELCKLMDLLETQGVHAIPFKGPTLALCAHGDVGLRQFGDLDILVHTRDVLKVKEILATEGFKPTPELTSAQEAALLQFDCAYNFANDKNVLFDVHWNLAAPYFSYEFDVNPLWERLEPITIGGRQLPALSPEDLLLALCLHGSTHFWERLGWISDVAGVIGRRPDIDWQLLLNNATRDGSKRMLSLGLFLASELLAAPLPPEVLRTVQADAMVMTLAEQVKQRLFAEEVPISGILDGALLQLKMRERKRDRFRSGLRLAATPRVYDWMLLSLPGWLFFLYYLLRPLRLTGKYGLKLLSGSHAGENPGKGR
jgi:hypothetical protein